MRIWDPMLGWWGLLRTGRKWEPGGNGTAGASTPAGQPSFPGLGRAVHADSDRVWKRAQPVRVEVGGRDHIGSEPGL